MEQGELKIKDTFVIVLHNEILGELMSQLTAATNNEMFRLTQIFYMKSEKRFNIKT